MLHAENTIVELVSLSHWIGENCWNFYQLWNWNNWYISAKYINSKK